MIRVTERAKEELKRMLSAKLDNPQAAWRLTASGPDKFVLGMDVAVPGDQVVEHEGSKVLLVEQDLADRLQEHTLAFEYKKFIIAKGPLSAFNKSVVTFSGKERKH